MAQKARCHWCGGCFVKINGQYWCESPACRERQVSCAIAIHNANLDTWSYLYLPLPKQVDLDSAPVRYLLGGGAAGVSKSHMARYGLYRRCIAIPGYEALILRNTWDELDKHHLRLMEKEEVVLRAHGINAEFFRTSREFRFEFPDGTKSIIEGGHLDDEKDLDRFLSRERDAIVCDEGVKFDPKHLLELSTRARSTKPEVEAWARNYVYRDLPPDRPVPGGGAIFWVLTNPGGPAATVLQQFFIDHEPDWEKYDPKLREVYDPSQWGYIPGNLEDNPYLPEDYESTLAVLQPWRYKQLRHNDWDVVAGQFFTDFDARIHVQDLGDPNNDVEWFRSMDWGFVNPGDILWWACLPDGIYYIRYEWKYSHMLVTDVAEAIKDKTKDWEIGSIRYTVADPATKGKYGDSGESISETFARPPCRVPLLMGDNDRVNGWQRVRELMRLREDKQPSLIIHPSCRYLIRSISAAISDKNNPEDVDTHIDDHALDALRYGAMSRPAPTKVRSKSSSKTFNAQKARIREHRRQMSIRR